MARSDSGELHVDVFPAASVTVMLTNIGWLWSILVDVTVIGLVSPSMNGGTGVSAFSDRVTTTNLTPLPVSWTVKSTWVGGPVRVALTVQVGAAPSTTSVSVAELLDGLLSDRPAGV